MKFQFLSLLCCLALLLGMIGCSGRTADPEFSTEGSKTGSKTESPGTSGVVPEPETEPNLRVVSMNVRMDLLPKVGIRLDNRSENRIRAVREQILSYEPDLIGLQEDVQRWIDNINIDPGLYTVYRPNVTMSVHTQEYCSIYVKNGVKVKDSGWKWLTSDGTDKTVTLTYAELTDGDGKYDMSAKDLSELGIRNDATLKTSYTGPNGNNGTYNYGPKLAARLMNWVIVEINGETVIYINTHLQHRGYNNREYSEHPLYMLRYYERSAQMERVNEQAELLKAQYPGASVIVTADFNDTSKSGFYEKATETYLDAMKVAEAGTKLENSWNAAYDNDRQGQGYVSPNENQVSGRIDFCLLSKNLEGCVARYRLGACKWVLDEDATLVKNVNVYPSDHLPIIVDLRIGT